MSIGTNPNQPSGHSAPWLISLLAIAALAFGQPAQALIYTYENTDTTSNTIPFHSDDSCTTNLSRTFTVPDSFTVSSVAIGLNLSHNRRGDVRAILVAPSGLTFNPIVQSGDTDDNYDILVSTNTEGTLDDGDIDPVGEPYYNRLVSNAGMKFYTGNAQGTWILRLCDRNNTGGGGGVVGTFNRARLILGSAAAATASCTSTVTYDWGANGDNADFTSATVGGVTITETSAVNFGASTSLNNLQTRTGVIGNHAGYYRFSMDAPTGTDSEAIGSRAVFSFSSPVHDLSFDLLDVDWSDTAGNLFEDQSPVRALDSAGNPVPFTATPLGASVEMAGDTAEGDADAPPTAIIGNVAIRFQGPVSTLTIEHTQGDEPTVSAAQQAIGISDFSFCAFDYGDAPNTYGTQLASSGARHVLGSRNLYLGANPPDGESNGAPGAAANTDDTTQVGGVDDEDGTSFTSSIGPNTTSVRLGVTATNTGTSNATLAGWIDFNNNGAFDAGEQATATVNAGTSNGTVTLTWTGVSVTNTGCPGSPRANTYARLRLYSGTVTPSPTGSADAGEVEDYVVPIACNALTLAVVSDFAAVAEHGGRVFLKWNTAAEVGTLGFNLLRQHPETGEFEPVNDDLLLGLLTAPQGGAYRYHDPDARPGGTYVYQLEEVEVDGERHLYGPYTVTVTEPQASTKVAAAATPDDATADYRRAAHPPNALPPTQQTLAQPLAAATAAPTGVVKLGIRDDGLYHLTTAEISGWLGLSAAQVQTAIRQTALVLRNRGQVIPWRPASGQAGIYFYGQAIDSPYTRDNVYWLQVGADGEGRRMGTFNGQQPPPATVEQTFTDTQTREEDATPVTVIPADPDSDYWYWQGLTANPPGPKERTFTLRFDGVAPSANNATLRLRLLGFSPATHQVQSHSQRRKPRLRLRLRHGAVHRRAAVRPEPAARTATTR